MAEVAAANGIGMLAATPHVREDHPGVRPTEVADRAATLEAAVREQGLNLWIVPGGEVAITTVVTLSDDDLRAVTLGGNERDLLIETPYGALPYVFEELLADLRRRGYRVTLAHPERNPTFQDDPRRLFALVEVGTLLQLTAMSIAGPRRSKARELAVTVLRESSAHVLASDAHSADWRPPDLQPGVDAARRAVPGIDDELQWMVYDAPLAILHGTDLPARPQRVPRKRRGWRQG